MLALRYPKFWAIGGWALLAFVVAGSLSPGDGLPDVGLSDKVQHAAAYFTLMVWFAGFCKRGLYPVIGGVLIALGLCLDLLQTLTETRMFEWHDVAMNAAGVAAGLVVSLLWLGGWCQRVEQRLLS